MSNVLTQNNAIAEFVKDKQLFDPTPENLKKMETGSLASRAAMQSGTPVPGLAGLRVVSAQGTVFVINPEGYLQGLTDPGTYNNLFSTWDSIFHADISTLAIGPAITQGAILAKSATSDAIYLISNNCKRWIVSPKTMDHYCFNWNKVQKFPQIMIDSIPNGPNWTSPV